MIPRLAFFLLGMLLLVRTPAVSQILNVEDVRARRDSAQVWAGSMGLDFALSNRSATPTNPVQFINMAVRANLARYGETSAVWLVNLLNYSAITGNPFLRTGYSHVRYAYGYQRRWAYEAFGQGQFDLGRGMRARWLVGNGARYNVVKGEQVNLHAGVGAMYEYEHWQNPIDSSDVYVDFLKSTNYLSLNWKPTDALTFHVTNYYQVGYDQAEALFRHRVSVDARLEVKVSERIAFRTNVDAAYENAPIVPIFKFVYTVTNGIVVAF